MDGSKPAAAAKTAQGLHGCGFLLGGLVAVLVAFPFLEDVASPLVLVIPLAVIFVAGVVVSHSEHRQVHRALAIAGIQVGLTGLSLLLRHTRTPNSIAVALALAAMSVLILYSTKCVLEYVLRARVITSDQIYAGICMYVMLGFAFGAVFYLINILQPGSFAANVEPETAGSPDLMYFSFVTLATLGYGDITPHSNIARSLSVVEALVGMVYIAVFMARLVSLRSGNSSMD